MSIRWDELRYFLAVARAGTIAGAARTLGVNESTVARHLNELESDLEARLFERLPGGYTLTEQGQRAMGIAERVEREVAGLELELLGQDKELSGPIRVTAPPHLADFLIAELVGFGQAYPDIIPELLMSDDELDLYRRQSDVAIRITRSVPDSLFGRRIGSYIPAVYGSRCYLASHDLSRPETLDWLGIGPYDPRQPAWIADIAPGARMAASIEGLSPTLLAVRRGLGLGLLPCYLGDADPELVRVGEPVTTDYELWLLTHESLRTTRRVRVFMDHIAAALNANKDLFAGRAGESPESHATGDEHAEDHDPDGVGQGEG